MEPNLIKKEINLNNQKKLLIISILAFVILLISSSYAILTNFTKTDDVITFQTGNLEISILNGEETFSLINLNNRLPESDQSGLEISKVVPITLKNTGNITIGTYKVKLISEKNTGNVSTLNEDYIRFSISEDNQIYSEPQTLTTNDNIIYTGTNLAINETKTIYLKTWIAETALENGLDKSFYGSLSISLEQVYNVAPSIINVIDAGNGKVTFTIVDNGSGVSEYCVNQSLEDTTSCTWYPAVVGEQTTDKIVEANGTYYVHVKDIKGTIGHSSAVIMEVGLRAIDFIQEKYGTGGLIAINTNGTLYDLSDGTQEIREYRYSGATANNYIFFDTDGDETKDTNEIWRIVGIFKDEAGNWNYKLMRNTLLSTSELVDTYTYNNISYTIKTATTTNAVYWNYTKTGTYYNDWTAAGIQYFLNGTDGYYGSFASQAQTLIDINYTYYLGNFNSANVIDTYINERSSGNISNNNKAIWNKTNNSNANGIALLYPSDYGYSSSSTYWTTILSSWSTTQMNESWMYKTTDHSASIKEWFLSPSPTNQHYVSYWNTTGSVLVNYDSSGGIYVRPVLYLITTAKLEDAEGTETSPYRVIE